LAVESPTALWFLDRPSLDDPFVLEPQERGALELDLIAACRQIGALAGVRSP